MCKVTVRDSFRDFFNCCFVFVLMSDIFTIILESQLLVWSRPGIWNNFSGTCGMFDGQSSHSILACFQNFRNQSWVVSCNRAALYTVTVQGRLVSCILYQCCLHHELAGVITSSMMSCQVCHWSDTILHYFWLNDGFVSPCGNTSVTKEVDDDVKSHIRPNAVILVVIHPSWLVNDSHLQVLYYNNCCPYNWNLKNKKMHF